MKTINSHVLGDWAVGHVTQPTVDQQLRNPATEEVIGAVAAGGYDAGAVLAFARATGGPALRALTFAERGELLRKLAKALHAHRDELLTLAVQNGGNTRGDAKFDVDGASATLQFYGDLGHALGATRVLVDGDAVQLGRSPRFAGQHLLVPRAGVALFVNAFNFPAWGIAEKAACALLAGMPVVAKPATATALVAHRMIEIFVEEQLLPPGALQLVLGSGADLVDQLEAHDVLAFTGSSATAARLRGHPRIVGSNARVNVEADSLNAAVLGADVAPGSPVHDLFIADVVRDMTQKTGQKCTAIRRVFVPADCLARVRDDLGERLSAIRVGDPAEDGVGMGPLTTARQQADVAAGLARLAAESIPAFAGATPPARGYFVAPTLFEQPDAAGARALHEHEVFGPVATIAPYDGSAAAAAALVARGGGGLVASVYSDDRVFLGEIVPILAAHHGRLYLASAKIAGAAPGPGTVLPQLVHGGPGRAGGGEELGGRRGMQLYQQRTAVSGDRAILDAITGKP